MAPLKALPYCICSLAADKIYVRALWITCDTVNILTYKRLENYRAIEVNLASWTAMLDANVIKSFKHHSNLPVAIS